MSICRGRTMRFAGDDCADDSDATVDANRSGGEYGSDGDAGGEGDRGGSKRIRRRTGVISSTLFC